MAILIDGVVVTAPVIMDALRDEAVIDGHLTKKEAELIVAGITIPVR